MHVVIVPADYSGCGSYRLIWPGEVVRSVEPDWQVDIIAPGDVQVGAVGDVLLGVRGLDPLPDVLVMQRVGSPKQLFAMRWAQERGVKVVVDFDDAMWCIDKRNAAASYWIRQDQHWKFCDEAARIADLVTVTTEGLARRYGKHGRVEIIPNAIPEAALDLGSLRGNYDPVFTAGWAGFTRTHPDDCRVSAPAARAVLDQGGRLRVVADAPGAEAEWGLDEGVVDGLPPQPIGSDYFRSLSTMDLMLVGLRPSRFNDSKSFLKVLEAGSQGVPAIAPANRPHRELRSAGYPVELADSPSEWASLGKRFATDASWREEKEQQTRQAIKAWTIQSRADYWSRAWTRALNRKTR